MAIPCINGVGMTDTDPNPSNTFPRKPILLAKVLNPGDSSIQTLKSGQTVELV